MRPNELPNPGPSYAELYAEGCFAQRAFINGGKLRELAQERGLSLQLFPRREVLEPLDAADAFSPIAFRQTNYSGETTWLRPDPLELTWREEHQAQAWDTHAWQPSWRDDPGIVTECYSPWQLLYVRDAVEGLDLPVDARSILDKSLLDRERERLTLQAQGRLDRWRRLDEAWRPFIKLLVALQTRLWPYRAGRAVLLADTATDPPERIDPVERAVATFEPHAVMDRFGLDLEELAWLHYHVAEAGHRLDPAPHLYRLLDAAPRKRTDRLRGDAMRARDLYDAAFLLRGLYYLATESWLPEPDELDPRDTVDAWHHRHLPRAGERPARSRLQLKEILIAEGVYPHLIHFFVEGDTEEIVLGRLLSFIGYGARSGMTVTNIRGIDKAERYSVLFSAATQYASRTVIVADREGEIEHILRRLREAGIFTNEHDVLLWEIAGKPSSFEEINFTTAELLDAMAAVARARNPDAKLTLTADTLNEEFQRRVELAATRKEPRPALGNVALELARQDRHGSIHASKTSLAPHLAKTLENAIEAAGSVADAGKERPLLARLAYWILNTR